MAIGGGPLFIRGSIAKTDTHAIRAGVPSLQLEAREVVDRGLCATDACTGRRIVEPAADPGVRRLLCPAMKH